MRYEEKRNMLTIVMPFPSKQYHIYLFERILLCCKDINPNKQKSKLMGNKDRPATNAKGKPRLQLKGRIYMADVTDISWFHKPGTYISPCPYLHVN
jgi:cell division control protein 24